jgi:hypothetical protein
MGLTCTASTFMLAASVIALAERLEIDKVATLGRRRFAVVHLAMDERWRSCRGLDPKE